MPLPCIPSELRDAIEGAIDRHGLANVIDGIAEICHAKAEHITANWQDAQSARVWAHIARVLARAEGYAARHHL